MTWKTEAPHKIRLNMDISTYCNAGCPQCPRTDPTGLKKKDWLPLVQWSIADFKKAISPEDFEYIDRINFVGSFGDCIMNKDIYHIVEYITSHGCTVYIETNGSIRDEDWWWDFGIMAGKLLQVRFDVDGINQEMHERYRRFTNLKKILSNMQTLASTQAKVGSQTVVFKHNQDYIQDIEDLCREYGSTYHHKVISDRFYPFNTDENGVFHYTLADGSQHSYEPADRDIFEKPFISLTDKTRLDKEINCRWMGTNQIYVLNDGTVVPCCYISDFFIRAKYEAKNSANQHPEKYRRATIENPLYIELVEDSNDGTINVFKNSIRDIMNSEIYTSSFQKNWKSDNPLFQCEKQCSSRITTKHQLREHSL